MPFIKAQDLYSLRLMARPTNVLIAVCTFGLSAFLSGLKTTYFLYIPAFYIQIVVMCIIMITGYWINDICDAKIDALNKPQKTRVGPYISSKKALTAYFALTLVGLLLNFTLPSKFILLNITSIVLLYWYAYYFKQKAVIGNLIIAWLTGAVFLAGGMILHLKLAHLWGMIFAFLITFIREVTKDIEDMKGDMAYGLYTLPISVGIRTTKKVLLFSYGLLLLFCWLPFIFEYVKFNRLLTEYLILNIILVQIPLIIIVLQMMSATTPKSFGQQSRILKVVIAFGLCSLYFL